MFEWSFCWAGGRPCNIHVNNNMDDILTIYKKHNRPGAQKLLLLAKSEGIQTTLKDVKEFIASRTEEQQLK